MEKQQNASYKSNDTSGLDDIITESKELSATLPAKKDNHRPLPLPLLTEIQIQQFWSFVDRRGPEECWLWLGGTSGRKHSTLRYGVWNYRADGVHRILRPHRIAWTLLKGPIPDDMTIDHVKELCDSTLCMNPGHFELVTLEVNVSRRGDTTPHKYRSPVGIGEEFSYAD